jgi:hypothetical protein
LRTSSRTARYRKILTVFAAVDELKDDEPLSKVMTIMNKTTIDLSGEERWQLPELVRKALKDRGLSLRGQ